MEEEDERITNGRLRCSLAREVSRGLDYLKLEHMASMIWEQKLRAYIEGGRSTSVPELVQNRRMRSMFESLQSAGGFFSEYEREKTVTDDVTVAVAWSEKPLRGYLSPELSGLHLMLAANDYKIGTAAFAVPTARGETSPVDVIKSLYYDIEKRGYVIWLWPNHVFHDGKEGRALAPRADVMRLSAVVRAHYDAFLLQKMFDEWDLPCPVAYLLFEGFGNGTVLYRMPYDPKTYLTQDFPGQRHVLETEDLDFLFRWNK